jgi:hypothetical protein
MHTQTCIYIYVCVCVCKNLCITSFSFCVFVSFGIDSYWKL